MTDKYKQLKFISKKILNADNFLTANTIFNEAKKVIADNSEAVILLYMLSQKIENSIEVLVVTKYYEEIGEFIELLKFLRSCPFQEAETTVRKRISIEKKWGDTNIAKNLSNTLNLENPINQVIIASLLNDEDPKTARDIIENVMLHYKITIYEINTYASIINTLMKNDKYACQLCIPNLARYICKNEFIRVYDFKRLLNKIIKYECDVGNKKEEETTKNILKSYLKTV